jgi:hypothetical protein
VIKSITLEGAEQVFNLVRERAEICLYRVEIRTLKVTPQRMQVFTINEWMLDRALQTVRMGRIVYSKERILGDETRRLYQAIELLILQGRM